MNKRIIIYAIACFLLGWLLVTTVSGQSKGVFDPDVELKIPGLVCPSCAIGIKNGFKKTNQIKEIKFYDSNFTVNKQNFEYFNQFLKTRNSKNIEIINSKVFFKNNENSETLAIATIINGKIKFDQNRNQKMFTSNGNIFNTKYDLELEQSLENLKLKNLILNFKDINLKIKNSLSLMSNEKISGLTDIDFFREKEVSKNDFIYHHIGIYAFTKEALLRYVSLERTKKELNRNLEQLRALENNMKIHVGYTLSSPLSVDTEEDLKNIQELMK